MHFYLRFETEQGGQDTQDGVEPHLPGQLWQLGRVLQQVLQHTHSKLHGGERGLRLFENNSRYITKSYRTELNQERPIKWIRAREQKANF